MACSLWVLWTEKAKTTLTVTKLSSRWRTYLLSFFYQHRVVFPLVRTFYKDIFLSVDRWQDRILGVWRAESSFPEPTLISHGRGGPLWPFWAHFYLYKERRLSSAETNPYAGKARRRDYLFTGNILLWHWQIHLLRLIVVRELSNESH